MVAKNTIVALSFNRKNEDTLNALKSLPITVVRRDTDQGITLFFETGNNALFSVNETNLDFDQIRGRTGTLLRTQRKDGEKIILQYTSEDKEMESDELFFYYAGNDEITMMSESHFKVINKVYSASTYNPTDIRLDESLHDEIANINSIDSKGFYSKQKAVRYRHVIFQLDEIIRGKATNELRNEALLIKRDLEAEVQSIRTLKNKMHISKAFQDEVAKIRYELMASFIEKNHGKVTLSKIESNSIKLATDLLKANSDVIGEAISETEKLKTELAIIDRTLDTLRYVNEFTKFINRGLPPKIALMNCAKCGSKPRLNTLVTDTKAGKASEVACKCGHAVKGGRIAVEAITKWNIAQGTKVVDDIDGLNLTLDLKELKAKVGEMDKFTHMIARRFAIKKQIEGNRYHKSSNKVKGMSNILMVISAYIKETMKK